MVTKRKQWHGPHWHLIRLPWVWVFKEISTIFKYSSPRAKDIRWPGIFFSSVHGFERNGHKTTASINQVYYSRIFNALCIYDPDTKSRYRHVNSYCFIIRRLNWTKTYEIYISIFYTQTIFMRKWFHWFILQWWQNELNILLDDLVWQT